MADADPMLIRAARAVIKALGRSCPALAEHAMTTGQCDAFYYPSDDAALPDSVETLEGAEYDASCAVPSHRDPGVVTLVA